MALLIAVSAWTLFVLHTEAFVVYRTGSFRILRWLPPIGDEYRRGFPRAFGLVWMLVMSVVSQVAVITALVASPPPDVLGMLVLTAELIAAVLWLCLLIRVYGHPAPGNVE